MRGHSWLAGSWCIAALALSSCGFHLVRSAALPAPMQHRVYLTVAGGGGFSRSLAAALRASKVEVLDAPARGVATLSVPVAAFSSRMLTSGDVQRVGEYVVGFHVQFTLRDAEGHTVVPTQSLELSHDFAVDQTEFSAISSETGAIERGLVREMTAAVMRRLQAHARMGAGGTLAAAPGAG